VGDVSAAFGGEDKSFLEEPAARVADDVAALRP